MAQIRMVVVCFSFVIAWSGYIRDLLHDTIALRPLIFEIVWVWPLGLCRIVVAVDIMHGNQCAHGSAWLQTNRCFGFQSS